MGLLLFSIVVSIVASGIVWLIAGDLLPYGAATKWDSRKNLTCYTAIFFVVIYILVFSLF